VNPGDIVMSKTLRRLGGAIRSRMEEYKNFDGLGVIVSTKSNKRGTFATVMLSCGKVVTVKIDSLSPGLD
jgi:hypothetical protein